jgi:pimeloyl-ACP methyl ester carboxylesterase
MQLVRHCTAVILALLTAATVSAQTPAQPAEGESELLVFVAGTRIGREQVRLSRVSGSWVVTSTANFGPPLNFNVHRFEAKYTADWQPVELHIEALQGTRVLSLATSFSVTSAINEITQNGVTNSKTDQISARAVLLPNNLYAGYEVLAARLSATAVGGDVPVYVAPEGEIRVSVKAITPEQIQTPNGTVPTRRYDVSYQNPGGALDAKITIDDRSRFVRLEIPGASLLVVRADLATVSTRTQAVRNATDTDVTIPSSGFVLDGTLTTPPAQGTLRHPAVVLVGGSPQTGRDENVAGVPIFAQLAGALADRGFVVLRYDKRGVGQSGGRIETATLQDYADDLVAAVKWIDKRKDVDRHRISVVGYGEGGWVAMLAAKEDRIASLVLLATPGTNGADLILEQQRHALDLLQTPAAERQAKIDLQTKIHTAVISERGWEGIPPAMRRQADTPWFRSLLLFDPAKVMPKVKQPILIIQGDLDTQVPRSHADKLAEFARVRKKAPGVEVKHIAGINHLLVPATTGETAEYGQLKDKTVSADVAQTIAEWRSR